MRESQPTPVPTLVTLPAVQNFHVGTVEFCDRGTSQQSEITLQIGAENLECAGDAGFSSGGQSVSIGTSAEDGSGAEADGFQDVGAAADTAIEQDLGLSFDGG